MKWLKQLLFLPGGWKSEIVVSAQMGSVSLPDLEVINPKTNYLPRVSSGNTLMLEIRVSTYELRGGSA